MASGGPLGSILGSVAGYFGNADAEDAQQEGFNNARGAVNTGYGTAEGLQQPIYQQGLGSLQNLSNTYNSGGFNNSLAGQQYQPTTFNANTISSDPEYQAELKQGQNAIMGSSEAQGGLFSGNTDRSLQNYGEQTAAQQENNLFGQNLAQNQFGEGAQAQAYGQQAGNNAAQFGEGSTLASNANSGANSLANLYTQQGSDLGNIDIGAENARANSILNATGDIQAGIQGGTDFLSGGSSGGYNANSTGLNGPSYMGSNYGGGQSGLGSMSGMDPNMLMQLLQSGGGGGLGSLAALA